MPIYNANPPFGPLFPEPPLVGGAGGNRFDQNKTIFAGMTIQAVQSWYALAQTQYLSLIQGNKPVTVSYEGKSVTYTPADANRLKAAIDEAQMILGFGRQRRALRPVFR